jgi:hypothetical protein
MFSDFICLTDIARFKTPDRSDDLVRNWLRNRNTVEFLGVWERLNKHHPTAGEQRPTPRKHRGRPRKRRPTTVGHHPTTRKHGPTPFGRSATVRKRCGTTVGQRPTVRKQRAPTRKRRPTPRKRRLQVLRFAEKPIKLLFLNVCHARRLPTGSIRLVIAWVNIKAYPIWDAATPGGLI